MKHYKSKSTDELEVIAESLLARFPSCTGNGRPDIESIIEQYPLTIVPRIGLTKLTVIDAYIPHHTAIILIDADLASDLSRYRLTLSEEISHRLLEPELWEENEPQAANIYDLDAQTYDDIEGDAYRLAIAILMPQKHFRERFQSLKGQLHVDASVKDLDALTIDLLSKEFAVTYDACASRCQMLGICRGMVRKKKLPGAVVF